MMMIAIMMTMIMMIDYDYYDNDDKNLASQLDGVPLIDDDNSDYYDYYDDNDDDDNKPGKAT